MFRLSSCRYFLLGFAFAWLDFVSVPWLELWNLGAGNISLGVNQVALFVEIFPVAQAVVSWIHSVLANINADFG